MIKKFAFTLAEVLITLVIVGIVSALTVPGLINKLNNQETVSRLKKAYSTLAQATNQIIAEHGTPNSSKGGYVTDSSAVYEMYKHYLKNAQECGKRGCWSQGRLKYLNGSNAADMFNYESHTKLVLSDGTQVIFYVNTSTSLTCTEYFGGSHNVCARIYIDVNGNKKPNIIGRDIFGFALKENGLHPFGCDIQNPCISDQGGWSCACRILRENAINY